MAISTVDLELAEKEIQDIMDYIIRYPEIERVRVFGSRATGRYRRGSDVDLAIFGEKVTEKTAADLKFDIEEDSYLPYFFDILSYHHIRVPSLLERIDSCGVELPLKDHRSSIDMPAGG